MGTGSGNSKYGGIDEWRSAIKKPPPVPGIIMLLATIPHSNLKFSFFVEKPPKSFRTRSRRDTGDKGMPVSILHIHE